MLDEGETHHGAKGDESDQSVRGQQAETDDKRVAKSLEFILVHAGIDDKQEDGGHRCAAREGVFDGSELGQQFGWEVGVGDIFVVGRERVALQAEGTDPKLSTDINLTARYMQLRWNRRSERLRYSPVGVQHRATRWFTRHRLIQNLWKVFSRLEGGVEGGDGHDCAGRLYPGRWPDVPRQTHAYMPIVQMRKWEYACALLTIALLNVLEVHGLAERVIISGGRGRVSGVDDGRVQGAYQTFPKFPVPRPTTKGVLPHLAHISPAMSCVLPPSPRASLLRHVHSLTFTTSSSLSSSAWRGVGPWFGTTATLIVRHGLLLRVAAHTAHPYLRCIPCASAIYLRCL